MPDPQDTRSALEAEAAANLTAWQGWQWRIDRIADYGLAAGPRAVMLTALTSKRDACVAKDLALLVRWRTALQDD